MCHRNFLHRVNSQSIRKKVMNNAQPKIPDGEQNVVYILAKPFTIVKRRNIMTRDQKRNQTETHSFILFCLNNNNDYGEFLTDFVLL